MNAQQLKGRINKALGKFKENAGYILGNKGLEEEGRAQRAAGKVQLIRGGVEKRGR